ncbi:MAG: hypothetical protein B6D73_10780 [gamma proteobacterium symbiont of Stewartia floridana]|nr:MAG: hypothetical protein B6D73_10780 [gamma proteobacterium symbiont of Stewartia floridana]
MRVVNEFGNLVFDDDDPRCANEICTAQGEQFAFVTALDIGAPGSRLSEPLTKRYWGRFDWRDKAVSVRNILSTGRKWPRLICRVGMGARI